MRLSEVLRSVVVRATKGEMSGEVMDICSSSKSASPSTAFFAIRGFTKDGHDFIADAISRGAAAVVLDREDLFERLGSSGSEGCPPLVLVEDARRALAVAASNLNGNPSEQMKLVGIVGTNGKTSVSYLLESVLGMRGKVGVIGTISYRYPGREDTASLTTPEPVQLQRLLSEMHRQGVETVILETSSHGLVQGRVDGCSFALGIFTNITPEHLDFHGTFENYLAAKLSFFEHHLDPTRTPEAIAVINLDDEYSARFLAASSVKTITYSLEKDTADFLARQIRLARGGTDFEVQTPDGTLCIKTALIGAHSVQNCLAAIAASAALGASPEQIVSGISSLKGVPGRFEKVSCGQDFLVVVDFAHTPDAIAKTLETARQLVRGRIISVFGAGGDRDATKRGPMGQMAAKWSDVCVITSDNPRTEDPLKIIRQVEGGARSVGSAKALVEPDRRAAIGLALSLAGPEDAVLILGKGHETYQIVGTSRRPFDDRTVACELLEAMRPPIQTGRAQ